MASVYPVFDVLLPSADGFNGSHLSKNLDRLDQVAVATGLAPLAGFIDARTMALEVLEEDQLPETCPPVRWYSAQEGLMTVRGLLSHYNQSDEEANKLGLAIVVELKHLEMLLKEADEADVKFHLLVDI